MADYEKSDVSAVGVGLFGLGLASVVAASGLALWLTLRVLDHVTPNGRMPDIRSGQATRGGGAPAFSKEGPGPHLQSDPSIDLARLRAEEAAQLGSYGWIDRKAGVIRIPVARAMAILAEPVKPQPTPSP